jgi:hypothetical protein
MASRLYTPGLRPLVSLPHDRNPRGGPSSGGCDGDDLFPALHRKRHAAAGAPPRSADAIGPRRTGVGPVCLGDDSAGWHR